MGFDDVILRVQTIGRYHYKIFLVLGLPLAATAFYKLGGSLLSAEPKFRCLLPNENPENATYQLPNDTIKDWPKCEKYNASLTDQKQTSDQDHNSSSVKCDFFVYDKTQYTQTVTTKWNLVCDNTWMKTSSDTLFLLVDVPGSVILGTLSDKYGRKKALLWGSIVQLVSALLVAISPNFIAYTVSRILLGMTLDGLFHIGYVTALEMVTPQDRLRVGISVNLGFTVGHILSGGLVYAIRDWRMLQIALTLPTFMLLASWWSIPESARWLLTKGRVQEAKDILENEFSKTGTELPRSTLDGLLDNVEQSTVNIEQGTLFDLMRYPNLRKKTLVLFVVWSALGLVFLGLTTNTAGIGGDPFLNYFIYSIIGLPGHVFPILILNRWGRRNVLCGSFLLSGIPLLLTFFVPIDMTWPTRILAMMAKFWISVCYAVAHIFTSELYPTTVRNVGVTASGAFSKIGGAAAPSIGNLFKISTFLPLAILGSSAIIAGLLSLVLPETLNKKLPETIKHSEQCERKANGTDRDIQ